MYIVVPRLRESLGKHGVPKFHSKTLNGAFLFCPKVAVHVLLRKLCYIESTIVPCYNPIMGAIFEYDINQA